MFELSDPDRGLLEQIYVLRFRLKFGIINNWIPAHSAALWAGSARE